MRQPPIPIVCLLHLPRSPSMNITSTLSPISMWRANNFYHSIVHGYHPKMYKLISIPEWSPAVSLNKQYSSPVCSCIKRWYQFQNTDVHGLVATARISSWKISSIFSIIEWGTGPTESSELSTMLKYRGAECKVPKMGQQTSKSTTPTFDSEVNCLWIENTLNSELWTLNSEPWTLNSEPWTLDEAPATRSDH